MTKRPSFWLLRDVAAAALVICAAASTAHAAEAGPSSAVTTAIARTGQLSESVIAYGTLQSAPSATRTIVMPHDGFVEDVPVRAGDSVTKGRSLVTISPTPAAAAQYAQARSAVSYAEADLARLKRLRKRQLASDDQVAVGEKTLHDAEAGLKAQNRMGAGKAIQTLRAPNDGVVMAINATPGEEIAAGTVIATIGGRGHLVANLGLEPEDAARLRPGAAVEFSMPLDGHRRIGGKLVMVGAMIDPKSRLVPATADISGQAAARMTLGLTLVAHISLPPQKGVVVPRGAILEDENGTYVFAVENGKAIYRHVVLAAETGADSLIEKGVAAGQRVIISGNAALENGMAVHEAKP